MNQAGQAGDVNEPGRTPDTKRGETGKSALGFHWLRAAILASSVGLMLPGAWGHSATVVEFAQLPAGLAAWQRGSLGIYRVCGPVSKLLYALPAYLAGVRVDYPEAFDSDIQSRREWELGRIFQSQQVARYQDVYRWSRLLPILMTVLGGCLVCEWSTRLFGPWPGIASLCVWCWTPPILAHGSLITSDMLSAVTLLLAARTFWAFLIKPTIPLAIWAGLVLGLAVATKFTLLMLYPCWGLLLLVRAIQLRGPADLEPRPGPIPPARFVACILILLTMSVVAINALYLFQDVGFRLADWQSGRSSLARGILDLQSQRATSWLLRIPLPIPLELLRGLDFQLADVERVQSAYLLGRTQLGGWWYWYPAAFLLKTPLPVLALFALAIVRIPRAIQTADSTIIWASLCLLIPAAESSLAVAASTGTGTNAAFRYLVPSMALLCVWVGYAFRDRSRVMRRITGVLLIWLLAATAVGLPDHLGWSNEASWAWERWSGRPALIGDSLDWGQDLARLGGWVSRHAREESTLVRVYGLGTGDPYGLTPPAALPQSTPGERAAYLAISVDMLFGYESENSVTIGQNYPSISDEQQLALPFLKPLARIGRTIRIYRLSDLQATGAIDHEASLPPKT
ncbi:ArnT family glycosyltransferase [Singulisphaera acidiphila]|uniref:Glycosyltransferase RgtA/B/C/D-like domain-containing protein n=1 Tax=Singulisphaera acidiphila (strain ATCC BAA-1392 / DSM 18658 / VKM B-2454 / MOB10) TaxID=886293 RepID=L0DHM3_SINAD|nr:hypothetical protein [Singulisphaera acidiphila]AGA28186.1 hypothetical protein Sinac_3959 [Singulisphaera acidiphila DSM 18658]